MSKKIQYLHDISPVVLSDKKMLDAWFQENQEVSVLGLTSDILFDDKLLFEWFSKVQNPDFFDSLDEEKLAVFFEKFVVDNPDHKNINANFIVKAIDDLQRKINPTIELMDMDSLNSGLSVDELNSFKDAERKRIAINLEKETKNYTTTNKIEYYKNIIPFFEKSFKKSKKEYFELKSKAILDHTADNNEISNTSIKKINEKWFALLYWIELMASGKQPPKSIEGTFIKSEIQRIGSNYTGTSAQSFYRSFIGIDLNNPKLISNNFGENWKNKIIELSNNNPDVIEYLKSKYN